MEIKNLFWYGHGSFRIEDKGKQIFIDPWKLPSSTPKADYIFITHSHYDHYSAEDVKKLCHDNTKIICTKDVAAKESHPTISMAPDQTINLDDLKIITVPAYNINKAFHPKSNNWVGYIMLLSDGTSIYHAGDTDVTPEMKVLKVDVALLPVSGTYVMTAEEAADAANTFKPKIAVPMHFGDIVGTQSDALKFKQKFSGETVLLDLAK